MKIYLATPVNGRVEATLEEKRKASYHRVCHLKVALKRLYPDAEFHSSFDEDIAPIEKFSGILPSEAEIMGKCVQRVMECDAVYLDGGWIKSKGCRLEHDTAMIYEKKIMGYEKIVF